jgi:hypothetical protein
MKCSSWIHGTVPHPRKGREVGAVQLVRALEPFGDFLHMFRDAFEVCFPTCHSRKIF